MTENVETPAPADGASAIMVWAVGLTDFRAPPVETPGHGLVHPVAPGSVGVYREPDGYSVICRYSAAGPMPPLAVAATADGDAVVLAVGRLDRTGRVFLRTGAAAVALRIRITPVVRDALDVEVFRRVADRHARQQLALALANRRLPDEVRLRALSADLQQRLAKATNDTTSGQGVPVPGLAPAPVTWLATAIGNPTVGYSVPVTIEPPSPRPEPGEITDILPLAPRDPGLAPPPVTPDGSRASSSRAVLPWAVAIAAGIGLVVLCVTVLTREPKIVEIVKTVEIPPELDKTGPPTTNPPTIPKEGITFDPMAKALPQPPLVHLKWMENRPEFTTSDIVKTFANLNKELRNGIGKLLLELEGIEEPARRTRVIEGIGKIIQELNPPRP